MHKEKIEALLTKMTLKQKIGQMYQINARSRTTEKLLKEWGCGSVLQASGERALKLQKISLEETELGIPLLFGIDAIHGHNQWKESTVFPTQLTLACSWNPKLGKEMAEITAKEMRHTGVHWTFSPTAELVRDLRWGRCDEASGEDPYLASLFVEEIVKGYQGKDLSDPNSVMACIKHFAGYCETIGGRDATDAKLSKRELLSTFLPVFEPGIRAGAASIMIAYNNIDGESCTTNSWLLNDILNEWDFYGFTVTDWKNISNLVDKQFLCKDYIEASIKSIKAGTDMCMNSPEFLEATLEAVESGQLDISFIDRSVRKILDIKFRLGLFDDKKHFSLEEGKKVWACEEHKASTLKAAEESIVLLKNENSILPLNPSKKKISVFGANAVSDMAMMGDWSRLVWNSHDSETEGTETGHPKENITTVLQGLESNIEYNVNYVRGCGPIDDINDEKEFTKAEEAAKNSDVAIMVLGDTRVLHGECRDRANIELSGNQKQLLAKIKATATPIVLIYIASKPLDISWASKNVDAIICAFNPGMLGGKAIANLIYGDKNFVGKLATTFPRSLGQLPVYYQEIPGWHSDHPDGYGYIDDKETTPLYPFGFGLSYTSFELSDIKLSNTSLKKDQNISVSVKVSNTGKVAGVEVVQVYINDIITECKYFYTLFAYYIYILTQKAQNH